MSNWKEINVLTEKHEYSSFYTEEYGLISNIRLYCQPVDLDEKPIRNVYVNYDPRTGQKSIGLHPINFHKSFNSIIDLKFYKPKTEWRYRDDWRCTIYPLQIDNAEEIIDTKYSVEINYNIVSVDANGNFTSIDKKKRLIISNRQEPPKIMVWATKDNVKSYTMPVLMDLQEGQKYFYVGSGICEVVKVYDYPNKQSNNICRIVFANGVEQDILIGDKRFAYIPTEYKDELLQFNITLNELSLQPVIQRDEKQNLINVMWQPVEDAARYVVKLYRYVNIENRRKVYFLKDYAVDRNEHFLSINDLIVNGHIIVVVAENRSGKAVAQSRGIDIATSNGEPKWF